jgi:iron complex transport system substrate-binding protein
MNRFVRRRLPVVLLAAVLAAGVSAACGVTSDAGRRATTGADSPGSKQERAEGFPVTIENCGRKLTFDQPPRRVVTGYQPVFETMVALGLGDRIVGRTNFEENGPDGFLPGHKKVYDSVPEIAADIELPQKEVLLAQQADFVISTQYSDFDSASGRATLAELDAAGSPAYITAGWCDPEGIRQSTIDDIYADLRNIGAVFGVPDRAATLTRELRGLVADVQARVADRPAVDVLATDGGTGPVNAYGGSGLMNQMIEIAGGRNVLADLDEDYAEVSVETVAASSPDALLVLDYATLRGEDNLPTAQEKADMAFDIAAESPAAQDNRYLPVPAAAAHSGYRNILAIAEIAEFLHPDAITG